jgi:Domain of unknown function (DUF4381)
MNEEVLRDIQPPMLLPEDPNYLLIAAIIVSGFLFVVLLLWFFKFRKKTVVLPGVHEVALTELVQLRKLMTQEHAALYAAKLSDILRSYIENRFQIPSSRQTSREFFQSLNNNSIDTAMLFAQHTESLKRCLDQCDLAKFAQSIPTGQNMEQMESAVQQFIKATQQNGKGEN